jgi:hypothetical protein
VVFAGLTVMDGPEPAGVPPQESVYQSMISPKPTVPESVADWPEQMALPGPMLGAAGAGLTLMVTVPQAVPTQLVVRLRARAKYVMVLVGLTLMEEPESTSVPPQEPVYQSMVSPGPGEPESAADWPEQMVLPEPTEGVPGRGLTVMVSVAQAVLTHPVERSRARA